jgi:hypothetical protein
MTHGRRLLLVLPALLAALVLPARGAQPIFKKGTLTLLAPGKRVVLEVEVADTPAARAQGLMFRRSLPESAGMLFVFETEGRWGFWMKTLHHLRGAGARALRPRGAAGALPQARRHGGHAGDLPPT